MITFDYPFALLLFVLIPPLIYLRHFWQGRGSRLPLSFTVWRHELFTPGQWGVKIILFMTNIAFWLGLASLILAYAGPSFVGRERIHLTRGIDIMIVLDESPSMAARDFPPDNRFERAREVVIQFIRGRENDPIGLVSFAEEAMLRVPPTVDYDFLIDRVKALRIMELGNGTAIGLGIAVACLHLEQSTADEQIIILITDGENNAGEILPELAARIAASMGIRIYTIGIGTEGEVSFEFTDQETGRIYRGIMQSDFDPVLLQEISSITRGRFYSASTPGALESIMKAIDTLESVEQRIRIQVRKDPFHRQLMYFGLAAMVFYFFIRKWILRELF